MVVIMPTIWFVWVGITSVYSALHMNEEKKSCKTVENKRTTGVEIKVEHCSSMCLRSGKTIFLSILRVVFFWLKARMVHCRFKLQGLIL